MILNFQQYFSYISFIVSVRFKSSFIETYNAKYNSAKHSSSCEDYYINNLSFQQKFLGTQQPTFHIKYPKVQYPPELLSEHVQFPMSNFSSWFGVAGP
jgi:hypothetical protein